MIFVLHAAKSNYTRESDATMEMMKSLGFKFPVRNDGEVRIAYDDEPTIEINTLEDLMTLMKKCGSELIVGSTEITIYNDYME